MNFMSKHYTTLHLQYILAYKHQINHPICEFHWNFSCQSFSTHHGDQNQRTEITEYSATPLM